MGISYSAEEKLFRLSTVNTSYQIGISELGHLLHVYYGSACEDNLSYLVQRWQPVFSANPADASAWGYTLDVLPQEYPFVGGGDYREACLEQLDRCGAVGGDFRYLSHRIYSGKAQLHGLPMVRETESVQSLEVVLEDQKERTRIVLQYAVYEQEDVITRSAKIVNAGSRPLRLERALSMCLDFSQPEQFDLVSFYGRHCAERNLQRAVVKHGKYRIDSVRGASSPQYNPFAILCEQDTREDRGRCYGFCFVYSGNFLFQVERDQLSQTRVVMGIHPQEFSWTVQPGDAFQTPEVILSYSEEGFSGLSGIFNRVIQRHVCPPQWQARTRPILLNSWEGVEFDFTEQDLLEMARQTKELGLDMFVLDDGWFGKRNMDNCSLGDWTVNLEKIPSGLGGLAEKIRQIGLDLGIWVEPEMISPDSDLYRAHPDWCLHIPDRPATLFRTQLVLDMTRSDVIDYLYKAICDIVDETDIHYIKWDMNRHLCEKYTPSLPPERQGETAHRYVLGVYDLLERLTRRYPDLLIEGCSGGGGRFDAGMLYYTPQIWCSDNSDPISRLEIQYGTSFCYPQSCVAAHVSASPNRQTGRETPLQTRFCVAAAGGGFGYELVPGEIPEEERKVVKEQIAFYRENQELIRLGRLFRLTETDSKSHHAWMIVDEAQRRAIVSYVQTSAQAELPGCTVKLRGLNPTVCYTDRASGKSYSGRALMNAGFPIPRLWGEHTAVQLVLEAQSEALLPE